MSFLPSFSDTVGRSGIMNPTTHPTAITKMKRAILKYDKSLFCFIFSPSSELEIKERIIAVADEREHRDTHEQGGYQGAECVINEKINGI